MEGIVIITMCRTSESGLLHARNMSVGTMTVSKRGDQGKYTRSFFSRPVNVLFGYEIQNK